MCKNIDSCSIQVRIFILDMFGDSECVVLGREAGQEWIFYDVAGSRTHVSTVTWMSVVCLIKGSLHPCQRGAWHPYFMDVKAIIFLAPISVFDERLSGDLGINRLEDSIKSWTNICRSKLLAKVIISPHTRPPPPFFFFSLSHRCNLVLY